MPSLSAYLKSNGIDVVQKDFNIEAYDILMSKNYLKDLKGQLQNRFDIIDSKNSLTPGIEQEYYHDLFKAKSSITYIAERIDEAKRIFEDKKAFYDIDKLTDARNILKQAQAIISTGCFPTGQDLVWPLNMRLQRSLSDIKRITQNRTENPFLKLYKSHLLSFIEEQDPDIIGISIAGDSQFIPALTLSRLIKSSYKKAHVVVGGYVITLLSDILGKYEELFTDFFDSAVLNEGERPLLELVEHISRGQDLKGVPNLIYYNNGKICANDVLPSVDINALPTPCFEGMPLDLYLSPELVLPILASRGCYWGKCAFCSHNESYGWHYQSRDANKVVDDMQELSQKHGVSHFAFSDEGISPSSISKLSDELIKRDFEFKCSTNIRLERQFTPELCDKMFKAGFRLLYLGLESGCNRILDLMEKGTTKEIAAKVCKNVYNAGIWNHLYTFFGFPTESRAEAQETIDFLLFHKNIIHSFNIANFLLNKGASIMKCPKLFGIIEIDKGPAPDFALAYNYTVASGLTYNEALELSNIYREKIIKEYDNKQVFKLDYEEILLYLSRFENDISFLRTSTREKITKPQHTKQTTRKSIPRIKRDVVLDKLHFNILDIAKNITNNRREIVYPYTISLIFDPVSSEIVSINPLIMDIITLCNGKRNIQNIAYKLTDKYDGPRLKIEEDCVTFLKSLERGGYIVF